MVSHFFRQTSASPTPSCIPLSCYSWLVWKLVGPKYSLYESKVKIQTNLTHFLQVSARGFSSARPHHRTLRFLGYPT